LPRCSRPNAQNPATPLAAIRPSYDAAWRRNFRAACTRRALRSPLHAPGDAAIAARICAAARLSPWARTGAARIRPLRAALPRARSRKPSMNTLDAIRDILKADFGFRRRCAAARRQLDDLAIDSLACIEVLFAVEDKFHITCPRSPPRVQGQLKRRRPVAYIDG
jgi:acyl carrier protein